MQWISVKDRLPDTMGCFLTIADGIMVIQSFFGNGEESREYRERYGGAWQTDADNFEVTHWMPLPEPPKE